MVQQYLVDPPDDAFQRIRVEAVLPGVGRDGADGDHAARMNTLGLQVLIRLPIHQKAAFDLRRLFDVLGRRKPALLVGSDDRVRKLRVPDSELVVEDGSQFPFASSSWTARYCDH